ncbi:MAG: hypothetical protein QNI91_03560 [Arenicellales bacterium]|nr:hypothetical protein [Arenicellales bacterium]
MQNLKRLVSATLQFTLIFSSVQLAHAQDRSGGIQFKPDRLSFGTASVTVCRPKKIEATNLTMTAISNPEFRVVDSKAFKVQSRFKCPDPLEPGETCRGYINFCPPYYEVYEGTLVFTGSEQKIPMTGEGRSSNQE